MDLENEINKSWTLYGSGVPVFRRGGALEVDGIDLPPATDPMGGVTAPAAAAPVDVTAAQPIDWNDPEQAKKYGTNTIGPRDGSVREDGRGQMIDMLTELGADPYRARDFAERIWGTDNPLSQHSIGAADAFVVPGAVMGINEGYRQMREGLDGLSGDRPGSAMDVTMGLGIMALNALGVGAAGKKVLSQLSKEMKVFGQAVDERAPLKSVATRADIPSSNSLSPDDAAIETRFADQIAEDVDGAIDQYSKLKDARGGKVLNTDVARDLSPDYSASNDARSKLSAAVHEPASWLVKEMYQRKLAEPPKPGERNMVLFTAGGTGAGKSSAIDGVNKELMDQAQIVYDTNMNTYASAKSKIDDALAAGKDVYIAYTYRDPVEALTGGALPRAMTKGRTVPLAEHAKTHNGAIDTILQLSDEYKNNDRVVFEFIDNSLGKGNQKSVPLETIKAKAYKVDIGTLQDALDQEFANGRISPSVYSGTAGRDASGEAARSSNVPAGKPEDTAQPSAAVQGVRRNANGRARRQSAPAYDGTAELTPQAEVAQ